MRLAVLLALVLLSACTIGPKTTGSKDTSASKRGGYSLDGQPLPLAAKAYQVTYSCPKNFAYTSERFCSDGAGHLRIEIIGDRATTPTIVQVLDLNTCKLTSWSGSDNKYIRRFARPTDPLYMRARMTAPGNSKPLGTKTINGHPCHGWKGESGGEVWIDDDYGCFVQATMGDVTTTMTSFSANPPEPSLFQPPPGYVRVNE